MLAPRPPRGRRVTADATRVAIVEGPAPGIAGLLITHVDIALQNDLIVSSTVDARALDPSTCDTGNVIAGGDPECTLRAAIEVVNAAASSSITNVRFLVPAATPIVVQSPMPLRQRAHRPRR